HCRGHTCQPDRCPRYRQNGLRRLLPGPFSWPIGTGRKHSATVEATGTRQHKVGAPPQDRRIESESQLFALAGTISSGRVGVCSANGSWKWRNFVSIHWGSLQIGSRLGRPRFRIKDWADGALRLGEPGIRLWEANDMGGPAPTKKVRVVVGDD